MTKEILLYNNIYSYSAADFISQLNESEEDVVIRVNSGGGSPEDCWGMIAKMKEKKNVTVKVDGRADSMALYFLCYANKVEALDVSGFLLHRAAYSFLNQNELTEAQASDLKKVNDDLRAGLEKRVNERKFKQITGYSFDDVFDTSRRLDIEINSKQALEMGLIDKINPINEMEIAAINTRMYKVAATNENINNEKNNKKMTLAELKSAHSDLYNEVVKIGAKEEKDRVGSWLVFSNIDLEAVKKGIADGGVMSQTTLTELTLKSISAEHLAKLETAKTPVVPTAEKTEVEETEEQKAVAKFQAELNKKLNIKS